MSGSIQPSPKRKREIKKKFGLHNIIETASECRGTKDLENLSSQNDIPSEEEIICLNLLNERNVESCPQTDILIGSQLCTVFTGTRCQCYVISES